MTLASLARSYKTWAAIIAVAVPVWGYFGWGNPFVLAKDFEPRMAMVEGTMKRLLQIQIEDRASTLKSRIQEIDRELSKADPDSALHQLLTRQRADIDVELTRVERELNNLEVVQ